MVKITDTSKLYPATESMNTYMDSKISSLEKGGNLIPEGDYNFLGFDEELYNEKPYVVLVFANNTDEFTIPFSQTVVPLYVAQMSKDSYKFEFNARDPQMLGEVVKITHKKGYKPLFGGKPNNINGVWDTFSQSFIDGAEKTVPFITVVPQAASTGRSRK